MLSKKYTKEDYDLLDELNRAREIRKVENENKRYALVCAHLLYTPDPLKAVCIQTQVTHEKHDGNIWCCDACAIYFDKMTVQEAQQTFLMREQSEFQKNIKSFITA